MLFLFLMGAGGQAGSWHGGMEAGKNKSVGRGRGRGTGGQPEEGRGNLPERQAGGQGGSGLGVGMRHACLTASAVASSCLLSLCSLLHACPKTFCYIILHLLCAPKLLYIISKENMCAGGRRWKAPLILLSCIIVSLIISHDVSVAYSLKKKGTHLLKGRNDRHTKGRRGGAGAGGGGMPYALPQPILLCLYSLFLERSNSLTSMSISL